MKKNIYVIHVNNGFSGSPNVLATVIEGLYHENFNVTLFTSLNNDGFLSDVQCNSKKSIFYTFKKNIFLRLYQFLKFQLFAAFYCLKINRKDVIYINTIQPFLPAIISRIRGIRVIYHLHESYDKKSLLIKFLFYIMSFSASQIICVSNYVKNQLNKKSLAKAIVIYNSLSPRFVENKIAKENANERKKILMISSAKKYKGILEFCELALLLEEYEFILVCDANRDEINTIFKDYLEIPNLEIIETQKNTHNFYAKSDIIVNLSIPEQFIETFGLTILEGMYYGLPAIVPPVGGITELIKEGENGFKVNSKSKYELVEKLKLLLENDKKYKEMSNKTLEICNNFNFTLFINNIIEVIDSE